MTPESPENPDVVDDGSSLAEALVGWERRLVMDPPEVVTIGDDSDVALAAAITAAKLELPIRATAGATGRSSVNARLIGHLSGHPAA